MMNYCDINGDNVLNACEIHDCEVKAENAWREYYCPNSEPLYCYCPHTCKECPGHWNCDMIHDVSREIIDAFNGGYDWTL
jgi:hypothetical protein